jgi:hypothetical protein
MGTTYGTAKSVKVTVNLPDDAVRALEEMKARTGTVTQALKEAIALKQYVDHELDRGGQLLIQHPDGSVERVVLLSSSRAPSPAPAPVSASA